MPNTVRLHRVLATKPETRPRGNCHPIVMELRELRPLQGSQLVKSGAFQPTIAIVNPITPEDMRCSGTVWAPALRTVIFHRSEPGAPSASKSPGVGA
jgi:hypothetical protein